MLAGFSMEFLLYQQRNSLDFVVDPNWVKVLAMSGGK